MTTDLTVRGKRMQISSEDVIRSLRDVDPGPVRKHAVEVQGVKYPVKQAFAKVTGTDVLDFDTNVARRLFQQLGFVVERVAADSGPGAAKHPARNKKGRGRKADGKA